MRPLIIERPELQTRAQRFGWASVTLACWVLWLYLFVPLLSLVAWVLGATLVYQVMLQNLELRELLRLLSHYGGGILLLSAVYLLWAVASYLRFRGLDRRQAPPPASLEQLAASHRLSTLALHRLRAARRVVVSAEELQRMFAADAAPGAAEQDADLRVDAAA
ncbi:MAG: poly-beta-1,6-N-acetyl-D-glucosamine biosynthesis protein PgaD [Pseudomonadales bacterium]